MEPFSQVVDLKYVDARTGAMIETVKMREFYEFGAYPLTPGSRNPNARGYVLVRHYEEKHVSAVDFSIETCE